MGTDCSTTQPLRARAVIGFVATLVALLWAPSGSKAAEIEGLHFAQHVSVDRHELDLRGLALLRYRIVFRAYVAAFYLPRQTPSDAALRDVPKRLEIEYFWALGASDIARLGEEIVERNVPHADFEKLRERLSRIAVAYRDIQPGDRYTLSYVPGVGTELFLNNEALVTIPGADFAKAYFSIWLGSRPLDEALKRRLLGGS